MMSAIPRSVVTPADRNSPLVAVARVQCAEARVRPAHRGAQRQRAVSAADHG